MNLRVALLFSFRWFVAASRILLPRRTAAPRTEDSGSL
jgi:hypothetical protein